MDGGRLPGDGAQSVLEAMSALDALVRRSSASPVPDAHGKGPYMGRLSAVLGQPEAAVKVSREPGRVGSGRVDSSRDRCRESRGLAVP